MEGNKWLNASDEELIKDVQTIDELILRLHPYAISVGCKYKRKTNNQHIEDLASCAVVGLIRACQKIYRNGSVSLTYESVDKEGAVSVVPIYSLKNFINNFIRTEILDFLRTLTLVVFSRHSIRTLSKEERDAIIKNYIPSDTFEDYAAEEVAIQEIIDMVCQDKVETAIVALRYRGEQDVQIFKQMKLPKTAYYEKRKIISARFKQIYQGVFDNLD